MRQRIAIRLLTSAALAAVLSLSGVGGANAEDAAKPSDVAKTDSFDADSVTTFSGAFLAARTADVDHDYETAIELYKKALQIEPGNPEIRQRLMISLLLNGDIKEGVKYANDLKGDPSVERITTILRGMPLLAVASASFFGTRKPSSSGGTARPTHAYMGLSAGLDFETKLFAKPDAAKLLERELAKPGYKVRAIAIGTNTDPYQPIEKEWRIMLIEAVDENCADDEDRQCESDDDLAGDREKIREHDQEPDGGDRAEEPGDGAGAARLHDEEQRQDHHRNRHDIFREPRRDEFQALDRREYRQRRRDHRIAEEEGSPHQAEQHQYGGMAVGGFHQKGEQRQRSALTFVVGAQQEEHIFDGDDDRQRPDHQRDQADDLETGDAVMS